MDETRRIELAIAALEAQRPTLGDAVVDAALTPLRERVATLSARESAAATLRRRQVTVLFADVVDSDLIARRLDAEDLVQVMSGALERFTAVVRAQRGHVLRYTGDGLKAAFGADAEPLENAPELAVRAGLAILDAARTYADELRAQHGLDDFRIRVGIHTGTVALGAGIEAENTAMGPTVNLAARLEQAAPPNGLRISLATYRHVRGVFDVTEQAPLSAKGIAEPVRSYLVHRAKPRAFRIGTRGIEGLETPMIGRDAELAPLLADFEHVARTRTQRTVSIVGEAGLGKSRLLHELQDRLEMNPQPFWLLLGRAQPHSRLQPYGLLRDLLAWRLQIDDSDSAELARSKLSDGLHAVLGPDAEPELLGHLIGLDFATSPAVQAVQGNAMRLRERAFGIGLAWLEQLSASDGSPVVLLLDDLHWADEGSLEFLRRLRRDARGFPLLIVMLARPEFLERQLDDPPGDAAHRQVRLAPLEPAVSRELVDTLLQRLDGVHRSLHELIIGGAEGNPFYMEELVKMLIDDGVIVVDSAKTEATDIWHVHSQRLRDARVPGTLTGVLQARLDALDERARRALQDASVIGHVFWDRALAAIDADAPRSLDELQRKEMTLARPGSTFDGSREYAFAHHLLHQVTYDGVLKSRRQAAHARAAAWLAERVHERAHEFLAVTAEHYARAGHRAEAARYFARAARNAAERYANEEALEHAQRGLDHVDDDSGTRWELLELQRTLNDQLGRYDAVEATLDAQFALAQRDDDPRRLSRVAMQRALLADRRGQFEKACTLALDAAALAERHGDFESAALAHAERAFASTLLGDYPGARTAVEAGVQCAQRSGQQLVEAKVLAVWANLETVTGADRVAADLMLRVIAIARQGGDRRFEGVMRSNLARAQVALGEFDAAHAGLAAALQITREIGWPAGEAGALQGLAEVELACGNVETAVGNARETIEISTTIGNPHGRMRALGTLARALDESGDHHAAAVTARETIDESAASGNHAGDYVLIAWSTLARATLQMGDIDAAMQHVERLLGLINGRGAGTTAHGPGMRFVCHQVLAAAHDERAPHVLAEAHAELLALADHVSPALREQYLNGVPEHHRIIAAWAGRADHTSTL